MEVVDYKDENGLQEANSVHNGQGKVELGEGQSESLHDETSVFFDEDIKINIILEIQCYFVVPGDYDVDDDQGDSPQNGRLKRINVVIIDI